MVRKYLLSSIVLLALSGQCQVSACEPCAKELGLHETIAKADVIVLGEKIAEGPLSNLGFEDKWPGGPRWIEIKIHEVLKGAEDFDSIKVSSWFGMCPYGIVLDEGKFIIFLEKTGKKTEEVFYSSVAQGCGLKSMPVINDHLRMDGKLISLQELSDEIQKIIREK